MPPALEAQLSSRDHSRGGSRTIEIKAQRKRSKSRDLRRNLWNLSLTCRNHLMTTEK
jgi:hypothetical protein